MEAWRILIYISMFAGKATAFWEEGTTTEPFNRAYEQRTSFFRWEKADFERLWLVIPNWWGENQDNAARRFLTCVAGISYDQVAVTTAAILNRRTLITAAQPLEQFLGNQMNLRVWTLGRGGLENTPWRYRVWRVRRVLPRSQNSEHLLGPHNTYCVRHDIAIIHTWDQMYTTSYTNRYLYPTKAWMCGKTHQITGTIILTGSGFQSIQHIRDNYWISYGGLKRSHIRNCEMFLPKWWGKFLCFVNHQSFPGLQNGGGLFVEGWLTGLGAFELRYNEERIYVFTDLRYYYDWIMVLANITAGEYYEYAYQEYGTAPNNWFYDGAGSSRVLPTVWTADLWPLG